jgi:hypothetical protein
MQAGRQTGQRGLAAPGLADQAHDLAVVHLQVHTVHRMHRLVARRAAERPHETAARSGFFSKRLLTWRSSSSGGFKTSLRAAGGGDHSR